LRRHGPTVVIELTINFVLPFVIFELLDARLGDVGALLASSTPPIVWSIAELLRHRRVDPISLLVLSGIALSILVAFGTGSARMLQLRENLVTGVIGLVFLGSAAVRRPLIYELAVAGMRRSGSQELEGFQRLKANRSFRQGMMLMTIVWGCGLLAVVAIETVLIFSLSIAHYLLVGPIVGYAIIGVIIIWTVWYSNRMKKRGAQRRTAEAAAAAHPAEESQPASS
jgi:hypothetical protein